jgi:glycerol-3-phosphate dehydrogenase
LTVAAPSRGVTLDHLQSERFDVLVVGGGIVGAAVAALGSDLGLAVALVDRGDFGAGTSSASSKLIHGGLRYLRMGDVRLVREAKKESEALMRSVAPHLVHPLRFLLPVYDDGPYGRTALRTALGIYRLLAGRSGTNRFVSGAEAALLVPSLRLDGLSEVGVYDDAQTNDARLCLANVRSAAEQGAVVANHVEVVSIEAGGPGSGLMAGVVDRISGEAGTVAARTVVNAAGAWVDQVRRLADPAAGTSVTLSKGAHLVLEAPPGWRAAVTVPVDASRVAFAVPWEGVLLLGTTDEPFDGDPAEVAVTEGDRAQILAEAGRALDPDVVRPDRILAGFAGLRVLPAIGGETASARRETSIVRGPPGMVTVAGGKLTTYRPIATAALAELRADLGLRTVRVAARPLPGAADPRVVAEAAVRRCPDLDPRTAALLARTYGSLAGEVVALGDRHPSLLQPLADGEEVLAAQVVYAGEREWAVTAEDVLRRRTTLTLSGRETDALRRRVAQLLVSGSVTAAGRC